jgi:hypothetical protein
VRANGRHHDVLGETPVTFAAEHVDGSGVRPGVLVVGGIDQHPRPDELAARLVAAGNHDAADIAALDPREVDRPQPPGSLFRVVRRAVRALTGPQVGVVAGRCAHAHEHLSGPRARHRDIAYVDHLRPTVPGDHRRPHRGGEVS